MLVVGQSSAHLDDTIDMNSKLDPKTSTWVKVCYSTLIFLELNCCTIARDSRKSRRKIAKNMANFFENGKNHGKITASNYVPKNHYKVYKMQHTFHLYNFVTVER